LNGNINQSSTTVLDQYFKRIAETARQELVEDLQSYVRVAEQRYREAVEGLKEAAKVILPVNVLEILSRGGYIYSKTYECEAERNWESFYVLGVRFEIPRLERGRYRVTVIIEKLEGEKK
jgi:hypothetical protein